jgi:predicted MFS family arabinose efflux permease
LRPAARPCRHDRRGVLYVGSGEQRLPVDHDWGPRATAARENLQGFNPDNLDKEVCHFLTTALTGHPSFMVLWPIVGISAPAGEESSADSALGRVGFRDVFAVSEFRALWLAQLLSVAGDQLARVALTVLVYDRTRSALLAALTYAVTIIPVFAGGILLSGLADRLPRRTVMIGCDVVRAVLVLVMAVLGMPLAALVVLLFAVTLFTAPFTSARSALYPDILAGDRYVLGTAITMTTFQVAQVAGFAVGGALVGFLGARTCLLADVATFAASAVLVWFGVSTRPAAQAATGRLFAPVTDAVAGIRLVFSRPALRTPMLFGWLAAFTVVPEGLAAPLAHRLHGGDVTVGLILASTALGISVGSLAFSRLVSPARRTAWMGPLAVVSCLLLLTVALHPALPLTLLVLFASGAGTCYQMAANAAFVTAAPPQQRSQAFGLAQAGIYLGQGGVIILAGAAATRYTSPIVIAASGAIGATVALVLAIRNH